MHLVGMWILFFWMVFKLTVRLFVLLCSVDLIIMQTVTDQCDLMIRWWCKRKETKVTCPTFQLILSCSPQSNISRNIYLYVITKFSSLCNINLLQQNWLLDANVCYSCDGSFEMATVSKISKRSGSNIKRVCRPVLPLKSYLLMPLEILKMVK